MIDKIKRCVLFAFIGSIFIYAFMHNSPENDKNRKLEKARIKISWNELAKDVIFDYKGDTPTVRVFVNGVHVGYARPKGLDYLGRIDVENWNPDVNSGKYRP